MRHYAMLTNKPRPILSPKAYIYIYSFCPGAGSHVPFCTEEFHDWLATQTLLGCHLGFVGFSGVRFRAKWRGLRV